MNTVKEIRSRHNLTQKELATRLGVSLESVCNWEQNGRLPTTTAVFDRLAGLAQAADMEIEKPVRPKRTRTIKPRRRAALVSTNEVSPPEVFGLADRLQMLAEGEPDESALETLLKLFIWYGEQGKVDVQVLEVAKAVCLKRRQTQP